jgi:hypothetical protein
MTEVTPATRRLRRVAPLALVAVLATACGHNKKSTATPSTTTTPTATVPTGTGNKAARKGTLVIGKRNILPLLGGSIKRFAPTQAEGKSLRVVAIVSRDAFWAGRSKSKRILVKIRLKGGSPPKIRVGQKVDFIGLLTVSVANAGALGVRNRADKTLLAKQGAYVDASALDVKLH